VAGLDYEKNEPNVEFLNKWKEDFDLSDDLELVLSPFDFGKAFFKKDLFPNVVLIDQDQNLSFKQVGVPVDVWFGKIKALLP